MARNCTPSCAPAGEEGCPPPPAGLRSRGDSPRAQRSASCRMPPTLPPTRSSRLPAALPSALLRVDVELTPLRSRRRCCRHCRRCVDEYRTAGGPPARLRVMLHAGLQVGQRPGQMPSRNTRQRSPRDPRRALHEGFPEDLLEARLEVRLAGQQVSLPVELPRMRVGPHCASDRGPDRTSNSTVDCTSMRASTAKAVHLEVLDVVERAEARD